MINQIQNLIVEFFLRLWKLISDIQITAIAITIGALGTKICGDSFWAVLFLSYAAVFFDTGTKFLAITKRYYADKTGCSITEVRGMQLLRGILGEAWGPEYLNSRGLGRIPEKILTLQLLLLFAMLRGSGCLCLILWDCILHLLRYSQPAPA